MSHLPNEVYSYIHVDTKNLDSLIKFVNYYHHHFQQSLTLPLQGFLNAIVYGWTRRDFVENMAFMPQDLRQDVGIEIHSEHSQADKIDELPERYRKKKNTKSSQSLDSSSRHFDYTTTECAESIQTTETDTEA